MSQADMAIRTGTKTCPPLAVRVTKSLLGYGVIAGPIYVLVSLAQVLTREGYDPTRHPWSALANGGPGWIQSANLIVTGVMVVAAAVGLRRALAVAAGPGRTWAPRLLAGFGLGMVGAGIFRADPVPGFPMGTPEQVSVSWHGTLHFVTSGIGFLCLIAAYFVLARRFAASARPGWAAASRGIGLLFLVAFGALAGSGGASAANLAFTASIVTISAWTSTISIHFYRRADRGDT
jgi:hypothetical membrane protein